MKNFDNEEFRYNGDKELITKLGTSDRFKNIILKNIENRYIISKLQTYIPQESIIGRILEHKEKCQIVLSNEKGIRQHDIYSWQIIRTDMIKLEKVSDTSDIINKSITKWLENTNPEQRKIFIDEIFELFYATNATTFGDIKNKLPSNMITILKTYNEISKEDRKTINEMIKAFGKTYLQEYKELGTNKLVIIKDNYLNEIKERKQEKQKST